MEKAFDFVKSSYLHIVLEHFVFHKNILKAIQLLYSRPHAIIKVNGSLSLIFVIWKEAQDKGAPIS